MSFFKRLLGGRTPEAPTPTAPSVSIPEGVKQMLFNAFGSHVYDDMVWLGQHHPEQAKPVYRGLEYIEQAAGQLSSMVPDAQAWVAHYVGPSVTALRQEIAGNPAIAKRFFVNSTEFQARIEHAVGTLQSGGIQDGGTLIEWLAQDHASQQAGTAYATFFNCPLSLSLAQDSEWMSIDNSPRTRMLLWGTLGTANVFAAHLLHHLKLRFDLPGAQTQGAVYSHLRALWLGYASLVLDETRSPSERAVKHALVLLIGDPQVLDIYGMHLMNVFRNRLYQQGTAAENYAHFAELLLPYAPHIRRLDDTAAQAFFEESHLLPLLAAETQWIHQVRQADITESHATGLCQNLNNQMFSLMASGRFPELSGFKG